MVNTYVNSTIDRFLSFSLVEFEIQKSITAHKYIQNK